MQRLQQLDMRTIGGQGLLDDDELEMGMLPPQRGQPALRSQSFLVAPSCRVIGSGAKGITAR